MMFFSLNYFLVSKNLDLSADAVSREGVSKLFSWWTSVWRLYCTNGSHSASQSNTCTYLTMGNLWSNTHKHL